MLTQSQRLKLRITSRIARELARAPYFLVLGMGALMGPDLGKKFRLSLRKYLTLDTRVDGITFHCENMLTYARAQMTYLKEDDTVAWLKGMEPFSVVWDIGANIGTISLKAAQLGHTVLSFEPLPGNYFALVKSINKNPFGERISAFCVALYSETKVSVLNITLDDIGAADNVFDSEVNNLGRQFKPLQRIAAFSITADEAVSRYKMSLPNYIKIDVDGNELQVLEGAHGVLASPELKGLLVEITASNETQTQQIIALLAQHGFHPQHAFNHEVGNVIFTRNQQRPVSA